MRTIVQYTSILHSENMAIDMTEFNEIHEVQDDFILEDFFPKSFPRYLHPFIEYRIHLIMKEDTLFRGGETQLVNTTCIINGKLQSKREKLSMYLVPSDTLPLTFESGGYIDGNFQGRIMVKLTNYCTKKMKVNSGAIIGYIAMQPYGME